MAVVQNPAGTTFLNPDANGAMPSKAVDPTGAPITISNPLPVALGSGSTVSPTPDLTSIATQTITAADTVSTTVSQFNGQVAVTGTPTPNSVAAFNLSSVDTLHVLVTGTWTGTLLSEFTIDGVVFIRQSLRISGTATAGSSFTGNLLGVGGVAGKIQWRLRATAGFSGSAVVKVTESLNPLVHYVVNALTLTDGVASVLASIKGAGIAATTADNAIVVAPSPSTPTPNFVAPQPVTAASLPLPTGAATAAKQPALGTSGTPSADVLTMQGASGMTPVKTDGSGVTQPVSASTLPLPTGAAQEAGNLLSILNKLLGSIAITATSLPLPTGAATSAKQPAIGTAGTPSADVLTMQGSSGMTPVKTDGSGVTQPVSAATLPLPTGAAQESGGNLAGINTKLTTTANGLKVDNSGVIQPVVNTTSSSSALTSVAASASSVQLLASNTARKGVIFTNDSTAVVYIAYAATATTTAYSFAMPPKSQTGSYWEMPDNTIYTGAISAIWASAAGAMRITELS